MPVLFEIPYKPDTYALYLADPQAGPFLQTLDTVNHGVIDTNAAKLNLFISLKEFRALYPSFLGLMGITFTKTLAKRTETQAFRDLVAANLQTARDDLRPPAFQYPAADATAGCGLNGNEPQATAVTQLLGANRGFCLGYSHNQVDARTALKNALDAPQPTNPEILFIEEFPTELQDEVDAFLTDNNPASAIPHRLQKFLHQKDGAPAQELPDGWISVLRKAKTKNARIFGLDSLTAGDSTQPDHGAAQPEQRDVLMNKVAKDVVNRVLNDQQFANKKFVAGMGAAHLNTHEGGIPGIAQILDVPALRFDDTTKTFRPETEDPNLRPMPSAQEQKFIDAYIEEAERSLLDANGQYPHPLSADVALFKKELYKNAKTTAARLLDEGELTLPKTVATAMADNGLKRQIKAVTDLFKNWHDRDNNPAKVAGFAVRARQDGMLDTVVQAHPTVLQSVDPSGDSLYHMAAQVRSPECMGKLIAATPNNQLGPLSARNTAGDTPAHLAIATRSDRSPTRMGRQTQVMDQLLAAGVSPDITDGKGRTPLHVAALVNNMPAVQSLHNKNADKTIRDSRGWTPCDVAIASTKTGIEAFLVANGGGDNNPKIDPTANTNTIDALMSVTKTENPADLAKARAAYEKLYKIPELRPMLKMLALDALQPRDTANGTGLRIVIADGDKVGPLFSAPGTGGQGSYDDGAHVVMVGSKSSNDFAGVLAHEFTHCAARLTTGSRDTTPFSNNNDRDLYRTAISDDLKASALLLDKGSDKRAVSRLDERMDDYIKSGGARRTPQEVRLAVDQEHIVNIPQLMAEFGPGESRRLAPNLQNYFTGTFTTMINTKAQALQNGGGIAGINDNALDVTPLTFATEPPIAPPDDMIALALGVAGKQFQAKRGVPRGDGNIAQLDDFELNQGDEQNRQVRLELVKRALEGFKDKLPRACSPDMLRELGEQIGNAIADKPIHEVDRFAALLMDQWVRDARIEFAKAQLDNNQPVSDLDLAEAIVAKAEGRAWAAANQSEQNPRRMEVDPSKHEKLVRDLAGKLSKLPANKKDATLIDTLAAPLSKNGTSAFYRKKDREPRHVSINVKGAENWWLAQLKQIKRAA